jgi:DNA-binding XRE family transcriptional regulator
MPRSVRGHLKDRGVRMTMTEFPRWPDVRGGFVAGVGGEEAITEARNRNQAYIDGHRLAELRKALGLTQAQTAERMGVTESRVSQIERGEVATIDAVARYVQAIGGTIRISAVFGDDLYILRGAVAEAE